MIEEIGIAIGEASMCWDSVPNGVFETERALDIWKRLESHVTTPKFAMDTLRKAFLADAGYAWGWHCNLAMSAADFGCDKHQDFAKAFMSRVFGVECVNHETAKDTRAVVEHSSQTTPGCEIEEKSIS